MASPPVSADRFVIAQRFTMMVNRYEVSTAAEDGRKPDRPVCFVEQKRLKLKEELTAFTDDTKSQALFRIKARQRFDPSARYDITDDQGQRIGMLSKSFTKSLFRSTWHVHDAGEQEIARAQERSVVVAVWRRVVDFVPFIGDLLALIPVPYHFEVHATDGGEKLGDITRIYGFRDQYLLDLSGSPIDHRVAIALAVGLDALQAR